MYLNASIRTKAGTNAIYTYYRLCESYRNKTGRNKWRCVLGLGGMEGFNRNQREGFINRLNEMLKGKPGLFMAADDPRVEAYTQDIFNKLVDTGKIDLPDVLSGSHHGRQLEQKRDIVKASTLRHTDVREIGAEHLCHETAKRLKLENVLLEHGFDREETALALTQVIARAVHPGSELSTAKWIRERSAVCTLSGYPSEMISKDRLYAGALKLFEKKEELENHLSGRTSELFGLEDKIIIYDLSNTYMEGAVRHSRIAKFGRSKEKRNDCKLIVLALVINAEGFPKHYSLFEGNMSDSKSLIHIVESLNRKTCRNNKNRQTVVVDAGIATEENLKMLRDEHYDYICVSRKKLIDYSPVDGVEPVIIKDKLNQPIELLSVRPAKKGEDPDRYLWVRSQMKAVKEEGMKQQFSSRFEQQLEGIRESLFKKGGVKEVDKVNRRIGRAQQKYPSVQSKYAIGLTCENSIVTNLVWTKKEDSKNRTGSYFLRTTLDETKEAILWQIYNAIREVEYTISVLKSDLELRPVYHKNDLSMLAHLHLGILAYWLVVTIRHQLKSKGIRKNWKQIVEIMESHKLVSSTMQTTENEEVVIVQCSEPNAEVTVIYQAVKISEVPVKPKKSVPYQLKIQKKTGTDSLGFNSS
jgi:transposase